MEIGFLMTEWLIFFFGGGELHIHKHTSLKDWPLSYLHFLRNSLLCLLSFPPFLATTADPYTVGHFSRLKDLLQHERRQKKFEQLPMGGWGKALYPFGRNSCLRNSKRFSESQEAKCSCIDMSGSSVL